MMRWPNLSVVVLLGAAACSNRADDKDAGAVGAAGAGDGGGGQEEPTPLAFDIQEPGAAGFVSDGEVDVSGSVTGDSPAVTVNGSVAEVSEGTFSATLDTADLPWAGSPLFPILGQATDEHGEWLRERVTLAVGESTDSSAPITDAIAARLTDHALLVLEPFIVQTVAELDLGAMVVGSGPVAEVLGADVYVTDAGIGGLQPELDFRADGLGYDVVATGVSATLLLDYGWFDVDGDIYAERVDVAGAVAFSSSGGEIIVEPAGTEVTISGLEVFGFDDPTGAVDGLANSYLAETLAEALEEEMVDLGADLLDVLYELTALEFSGINLDTVFTGVSHDDDGVTLTGETAVSLVEGQMPDLRLSNPRAFSRPTGQTTSEGEPYALALFLDDDLLSALGAALVGAGVLEQEVSGDLGGLSLDTTLLGASIPGFDTLPAGEPVVLTVTPTLTPVGTAGEAAPEAGRLHLGGLSGAFTVPSVESEPVMTVALDAIVSVGMGDEELLAVDVIETNATLVSTSLGAQPSEVEAGLDSLLGLAVPLLVRDLLGGALDLSSLPVEVIPLESRPVDDRAGLYLDIGDISGLDL